MRLDNGDMIDVVEAPALGKARVRIREDIGTSFLKASIHLTADELATHARECLAIAESMREMESKRGQKTDEENQA